ncbi:MAG: hypothetical protein ACFCUM_06495 [Bacteroidales bacterium]
MITISLILSAQAAGAIPFFQQQKKKSKNAAAYITKPENPSFFLKTLNSQSSNSKVFLTKKT